MPISDVRNMDCMDFMKEFPDGYFDLAIVDPPYGIDRSGSFGGKNWKKYKKKNWDDNRPSKEYWRELFRVSKNQIVWGANYFTQYLPSSMGWIFWDKGQDLTMSDGELAFSSFDRALRRVEINRCYISEYGGNIHQTQKPVRLYVWVLKNYANPTDKILDTHLGSGSSRIASYKLGFDFYATEMDIDHYNDQEKRFKQAINEPLFDNVSRETFEQSKLFYL